MAWSLNRQLTKRFLLLAAAAGLALSGRNGNDETDALESGLGIWGVANRSEMGPKPDYDTQWVDVSEYVPSNWKPAFEDKVLAVVRSGMSKLAFMNLTCAKPSMIVVLKVLKTSPRGLSPETALHEAKVMKMLNSVPSPYLVKLFAAGLMDVYDEDDDVRRVIVLAKDRSTSDLMAWHDSLVLVMEHLPGGDLYERYRSLTMPRRLQLFQQLVKGVHAMHTMKIRHGDLKPDQVMLTSDNCEAKSCIAKLIDFGSACEVDDKGTRLPGTNCGPCTPQYKSPEQWYFNSEAESEDDWSKPETLWDDHWALGAILYELVMDSGLIEAPKTQPRYLWNFAKETNKAAENAAELGQKVAKQLASELGNDAAAAVGDLVKGLLNAQPEQRTKLESVIGALQDRVLNPLGAAAPTPTQAPVPICGCKDIFGPALSWSCNE